ncbi:MAG: nitronate monooxygenase, partial [Cetobacterium sp.]
YKQSILKAKDRSTVATGNYTGHPVRVIHNKLAKNILDMEKQGASKETIEEQGRGKLRLAVVDGDVELGSVMAGQVAGMVNERKTCEEIINYLVNGLNEAKEKLNNRINSWN